MRAQRRAKELPAPLLLRGVASPSDVAPNCLPHAMVPRHLAKIENIGAQRAQRTSVHPSPRLHGAALLCRILKCLGDLPRIYSSWSAYSWPGKRYARRKPGRIVSIRSTTVPAKSTSSVVASRQPLLCPRWRLSRPHVRGTPAGEPSRWAAPGAAAGHERRVNDDPRPSISQAIYSFKGYEHLWMSRDVLGWT